MKENELPRTLGPYIFVTSESELDCICAYLGITDARDCITAALVTTCDGDYGHVYMTEGTDFKRSANWDWEPYTYYVDEDLDELYLQDLED